VVPLLPLHLIPEKYPTPSKPLWKQIIDAARSTIGRTIFASEGRVFINMSWMSGICDFL
jgi:hypothetical protein